MNADDVLRLLRQRIREAGNPCAWADRHGCHRGNVYEALAGKRKPGPEILIALGLRRRVVYEQKG